MARTIGRWVARRVERRLRDEWDSYDHRPEVKLNWSRGQSPAALQNPRSLVQVNFYRHPRGAGRR
jgi:hypothetical protein